jgi:F420-non-reducing hydrogenase small subunit
MDRVSVCDQCPRSRPERIKRLRRDWWALLDRKRCLLEQGVVCCGFATLAGCRAVCPRGGSPCIGCLGLLDGGEDFAASMVKALAAIVDRRERDEVARLEKAGLHDSAELFHRFNLGHRMMRRRLSRARGLGWARRPLKRR